jgi:hypothetical protein
MVLIGRHEPNRDATDPALPSVPARGRFVELWKRPIPDGGREEHLGLERCLARLDDAGAIDGYAVHEWTREVCVRGNAPRTPKERTACRRVEEFLAWASARDASLPDFERETVGTGRMGPEREAIVLPATVLAVYEDGVLQEVLPRGRRGHRMGVTEWIEAEEEAVGIEDRPLEIT